MVDASSESSSAAAGALDKAGAAAHSAVNRAIDAAGPAARWLDERTRSQQDRYEAAAHYAKQKPVQALIIAFVAGVLIGKIIL